MATITTNEMIFRTLKTKVWNYKGDRNPEPKYAEQLRSMGYEVCCNNETFDVDARWMVDGHEIYSCEGKDTSFSTAHGYVEGMANIAKIDFVNLFKVYGERKEKRVMMMAHDNITDERVYCTRKNSIYMSFRNGRRGMHSYTSRNLKIEQYKRLRADIDDNCRWERKQLASAQEKLIEAQKAVERAKAALEREEAKHASTISKLDELLKEAGVR